MRNARHHLWKGLPVGAVAALSGCANLTVLNPRGQVGSEEKTLILTAAILMLLVVVPVIVLTVVFALRYRASNTKAKFTPEWSHSKRIETVIWLVPLAIITTLGILTWISTHKLDPYRPLAASGTPVTIEAISLDWKWLFIYPDERIASVNEIAFPTNVPINFQITSDTVMNSFFIPQLGSQIYSMAGMRTQLHLISDAPGTYAGLSSNFSGQGFSNMRFSAISTSEEQFEDWVSKARQSPDKLDLDAFEALEKPSEDVPVQYFSDVTPHLFEDVIAKYMTGAGSMQMTGQVGAQASN